MWQMLNWLADTLLERSLRLRCQEIDERKPLYRLGGPYPFSARYRLQQIGVPAAATRWQPCLCSVERDGFHLYPRTRKWDQHVQFEVATLRWFGRPHKYQPGNNDIWLHFEKAQSWHVLMLQTDRYPMQQFVRAIKQIATGEHITAYRRQRPHVHLGPLPAQYASEDLYGVWTVEPQPLSLYLMPSALVELQTAQVQRILPLETIQDIEVMRRLDVPDAHGVVRFKHVEAHSTEYIAYTSPAYVEFAQALIAATRRTLKNPPTFYGKKEDEDEW
ncbi:MAG: hypothetical protein SF123_11135 [Chloroflexota bacterium]|nr:hypothetical protein [Chloroflexota bacterium]